MDDAERFDQSRYRYWTEDHVRFSDLDPLGHVNNNSIGQYFENARATLFLELTPHWPNRDQLFVLARTAIDFRAELHMPAKLRIGTSILRTGKTSVTFCGAVFHDAKGIAYCESVSVFIDRKTRKPVEIPDALRKLAEKYLVTA